MKIGVRHHRQASAALVRQVPHASLLSPNFYTAFPSSFKLRYTCHLGLVKSRTKPRPFRPHPSPSTALLSFPFLFSTTLSQATAKWRSCKKGSSFSSRLVRSPRPLRRPSTSTGTLWSMSGSSLSSLAMSRSAAGVVDPNQFEKKPRVTLKKIQQNPTRYMRKLAKEHNMSNTSMQQLVKTALNMHSRAMEQVPGLTEVHQHRWLKRGKAMLNLLKHGGSRKTVIFSKTEMGQTAGPCSGLGQAWKLEA